MRNITLALALVGFLGSGCTVGSKDDTAEADTDTDTDTDKDVTRAMVDAKMVAECGVCHDSAAMDLATDWCGALKDVPSSHYKGELRIDSGSASTSVLYHKLVGTTGYEEQMPKGADAWDQKWIDWISAWIDDGAVCE